MEDTWVKSYATVVQTTYQVVLCRKLHSCLRYCASETSDQVTGNTVYTLAYYAFLLQALEQMVLCTLGLKVLYIRSEIDRVTCST